MAESTVNTYATTNTNAAASAPNTPAVVSDGTGERQIVVLGAGDGTTNLNDGSVAHPVNTLDTNSATIATNTGNSATSANQTNGTQQTKLTDGTNVANVVPGDSGFNGLATASATKTYTFTTSASGAQTILANTPTEGFAWIEVVYTSVGSGLALTGQYSTASGGTYLNSSSFSNNVSSAPTGALGATVSTLYYGPVKGNFFQIAVSALTSGTFAGTVTLRAIAPPSNSISANQNGTWIVGSNSATGSAFPANAFGQGVLAKTASPTAATTGNLVAILGNTMGMPVIATALLNSAIAVSSSATVVKSTAGWLSGVLVTTAGTSTAMTIYDNASAASGTIIGYIPSGAVLGGYYPFNMPAANGITVSGSATNPAVTLAYS